MSESPSAGPLEGVRVLDLGVIFAGPLAGSFLADYGADVVKVERPGDGDPLRHLGWRREDDADSLWWKFGGRNKRSIAADLSTAEGRDLVLRLASRADVVIENFRPGTLERWGLGPDVLHATNPALIVLRVSGFGQHGPYRDLAGFGSIAESMSGFAEINGWPDRPPALPPFGLADGVAALSGAFAIVTCLFHQLRSGAEEGQVIDIGLLEPLVSILGPQATVYDGIGLVQTRTGNRTPYAAPRNTYPCAGGKWLALSSVTQQITVRVFAAIGRPELIEDPRFATNEARVAHVDELDDLIGEWTRQRPVEECLEVFRAAGAAVAPIYSVADTVADPHVVEREVFVRVPDVDDEHTVLIPNVIARLSATPGRMRHGGRALDADRDAILADWLDDGPPERSH